MGDRTLSVIFSHRNFLSLLSPSCFSFFIFLFHSFDFSLTSLFSLSHSQVSLPPYRSSFYSLPLYPSSLPPLFPPLPSPIFSSISPFSLIAFTQRTFGLLYLSTMLISFDSPFPSLYLCNFTRYHSPLLLSHPNSYPIQFNSIQSNPLQSNPIQFNPILSNLIPFHSIHFSFLSYPILSYPILSYPILSYLILSYSIIFYSILSAYHLPLKIISDLHPAELSDKEARQTSI